MIAITLPLRTRSEANTRSAWQVKAKRVKAQREAVALALAGPWRRAGLQLPLVVTLTRIAPRMLDDDNNVASAKFIRDSVASVIGIDDRSDLVTWRYAQRKGQPREYAIEIRVEAAP